MMRGPLLAAITIVAGVAQAAVIQKDSEGGVVTVSNGLVMKKFPGGEMAVFDSKLGLLTAVFPDRGIYTTFTQEQFCNSAIQGDGSEVEDVTGSMFTVFDAFPAGRYRVDVANEWRVFESSSKPRVVMVQPRSTVRAPGEPPRVRVVDKGAGGKMAGFRTQRYRIFVDGELEEEVWMAEDPRLVKELGKLDMRLVLGFFECDEEVKSEESGPGVDDDDEYRELFERGWPMRIKSGGDDAYFKVTSIQIRPVPASEFSVPQRFRAVPFNRRLLRIDDAEE